MMNSFHTTLDVKTGSPFFRWSHENTNLTSIHLTLKLKLSLFVSSIVNKSNLFFWNSSFNKQIFQLLINRETLAIRSSKVRENHLCPFMLSFHVINLIHSLNHLHEFICISSYIELCIKQTHIQSQLSGFTSDFEHIIFTRIYTPIFNSVWAFYKLIQINLLVLSQLTFNRYLFYHRNWKIKVFSHLDICSLTVNRHQLREIHKFSKAFTWNILVSSRIKLETILNNPKYTNPGIKETYTEMFHNIWLKIIHHRIHFTDRVGNRRTSRKDNVTCIMLFLKHAHLHFHIHILFWGTVGNTSNVPQTCHRTDILVPVGFINKEHINTKAFKVDKLINTSLVFKQRF